MCCFVRFFITDCWLIYLLLRHFLTVLAHPIMSQWMSLFPAAVPPNEIPLEIISRLLFPRTNMLQLSSRSRNVSPDLPKVKHELEQFKVMLNVVQFQPDEIEVKVVDNYVVISGKHDFVPDDHGQVTRKFTTRFVLPEDVKPETVEASFSGNGILTVFAKRKVIQLPDRNEKIVPITILKAAVGKGEQIASRA